MTNDHWGIGWELWQKLLPGTVIDKITDKELAEIGKNFIEALDAKDLSLESKLQAGRDLCKALEFIEKNDKTEYDYHGKRALNRFGEKPNKGTCFMTPAQLAKEALQSAREKGLV